MTEINIHKSNNRYIVFNIFLLALGIVVGILVPETIIDSIIQPTATLLTQIILYFTIPYFIFSTVINSFELIGQKTFVPIVLKVMFCGFILIVVLTLLSMLLFNFLPFALTVPFIPDIVTLDTLNFTQILEILFPGNFLQTLSTSKTSIASILIVSCLVGSMAINVINRGHVFFDTVDALRNITLKILKFFLPYYSICVFFNIAVISTTLRQFDSFDLFANLFGFLISLLILLLFIVYPLILFLLKVPISYKIWCRQIIPAVCAAFATTNILASGALLLHVEELGYSRKRINDITVTFSLVFARVGTAITIALSYLSIYKIYSSIPVSITFFLVILLGSVVLAYLSSAFISSIFITAIVTLSQIPSVNIQELYTIIIPVQLVIAGFAAGIDALSCAFVQLYVANAIKKDSYSKEEGSVEEMEERAEANEFEELLHGNVNREEEL